VEKKGEKLGKNFFKLLKTHIEKMPVFGLSMIFMKTNELNHSFQDITEKKGVIKELWRGARDRVRSPKSGVRSPKSSRTAMSGERQSPKSDFRSPRSSGTEMSDRKEVLRRARRDSSLLLRVTAIRIMPGRGKSSNAGGQPPL
jgi:hypothetical protein